MTKEDIIRMARQVEAEGFAPVGVWPEVRRLCELAYDAGAAAEREKWMERTAILIRGEREACAKVCEEYENDMGYGQPQKCADAIRARGETK